MKGEKEEEGKVMDAKNWKERKTNENKKRIRITLRLRKIKVKGIKTLNKELSCTRGNPGHKHRMQKKRFRQFTE